MAHEGLWEKLEDLDQAETARRAGCQYLSDPERYLITMLNTDFIIRTTDRTISAVETASSERPAEFLEQLCILAYLIDAKDLPLSGELVNGLALPGGQFFFRGVHCLPTGKLEQAFGDHPKNLLRAAKPFAAEESDFGDASVRIRILPRVPVTVVLWDRCEEFEPRASILFDKTAGDHLPLDALLAAVNLGVKALTQAAGEGK
jgi:hypothetical protein